MNQEYDFESANAKFNKEDVAKEVAAAHITTPTNGTTTEGVEVPAGPSSASLAAALAGDGGTFYDKGKSFFDNISCENKDRAAPTTGDVPATHWRRNEERKLNMETFGQASVDYGGPRFGRGGYRGGRGMYRGGRGGGIGYRGGYRGANPWRGGPPRTTTTNGSNSGAPPTTNTSTTA
jgi:protein LSM14